MNKRGIAGVIAIILAIMMVLTTIQVTTFADLDAEQQTTAQEEVAVTDVPEEPTDEAPAVVEEPAVAEEPTDVPVEEVPSAEPEVSEVATEAPVTPEAEVSPAEEATPAAVKEKVEPETKAEEPESKETATKAEKPVVKEKATKATTEKNTEAATEETKAEEEVEYPALDVVQTIGGVTVSFSAPEGSLPEGTTVSIAPVTADYIFDAVAAEIESRGQELADAVAFDITPKDKDGNEVQPIVPVTVSFQNTGLDVDNAGEVSVFRVADDASAVTEIATDVANANAQKFSADHFTIYVGTSVNDPNGDGTNQPNDSTSHRYILQPNSSVELKNDHRTATNWRITAGSNYISLSGTTITNTNNTGSDQNATVECTYRGSKTDTYYITVKPNKTEYKVTFKLQDAGESEFVVFDEQTVDVGEDAEEPDVESPKTVDGVIYEFDKWYADEACTEEADLTKYHRA